MLEYSLSVELLLNSIKDFSLQPLDDPDCLHLYIDVQILSLEFERIFTSQY